MIKITIDNNEGKPQTCTGDFAIGCITKDNPVAYDNKLFIVGSAGINLLASAISNLIAESVRRVADGDKEIEAIALCYIMIKTAGKLNEKGEVEQ